MMVWKIYILLYKYGHICYLCYISFWGASSQTEALKFYPTCFWLGTPPQKIPNEYPLKVDQQKNYIDFHLQIIWPKCDPKILGEFSECLEDSVPPFLGPK